MFDEHITPRRFWAKAIHTACHVLKRIFLRAFLNKTSYEMGFGQPTKVSHLMVLDADALFQNTETWTNLSLGHLMGFSWVMHYILVLIVFLTWRLTALWRLVRLHSMRLHLVHPLSLGLQVQTRWDRPYLWRRSMTTPTRVILIRLR
jgi:hypothetical protein